MANVRDLTQAEAEGFLMPLRHSKRYILTKREMQTRLTARILKAEEERDAAQQSLESMRRQHNDYVSLLEESEREREKGLLLVGEMHERISKFEAREKERNQEEMERKARFKLFDLFTLFRAYLPSTQDVNRLTDRLLKLRHYGEQESYENELLSVWHLFHFPSPDLLEMLLDTIDERNADACPKLTSIDHQKVFLAECKNFDFPNTQSRLKAVMVVMCDYVATQTLQADVVSSATLEGLR